MQLLKTEKMRALLKLTTLLTFSIMDTQNCRHSTINAAQTQPALEQTNNDFYDINTINTIELFFSHPNWDNILDSLYIDGNKERLVGTAVINNVQYDSVGVRYKGGSSYNAGRKKKPLNIKLDHIIVGQKIDGYGTLKLANVFKDPGFVREIISYEIARKYMPCSKANFANVYINGTLIGLYSNVQNLDKFFLKTHFHSNDNAFFKGVHKASEPTKVWGYFGTEETRYYNYYELKSDSGWSDLIGFLDIFNNNPDLAREVLNIDRHLWMLAFNNLMVNLDAPINSGRNFYLYKDMASQFNPIIWDLNENFGGFTMLIGSGTLNVMQMQQLNPLLNMTNPNYPIINKILLNPTYQRRYVAHMRTMIAENFSNNWYLDRALEIQNIIATDVQADPNKFYTYNDFLNNIYNSTGSGAWQIVGLAQLMDARVMYLTDLPIFQATPPTISDISYTPTNVQPNSNVQFTAKVKNAKSVTLGYRQDITGRFKKQKMFYNTMDGIYEASVLISTGDLHYYIYAENDEAGMFFPERAEYEFLTLNVTGTLVINEFMAINKSTIADQNGEYDDWIELFNAGDSLIPLKGYYLTDNKNNLTRWVFPDTFIRPDEYLIIWADGDTLQPGLHTNFKLSGSGEEIILSDPGQTIIDYVAFGQQIEDISTGRYPDGTGPFVQMPPTPGAENDTGFMVEEKIEIQNVHLKAYPNPFTQSTIIYYSLDKNNVTVNVTIYDVSGREVETLVDGKKAAGKNSIAFDARNLTGGIYFVKLVADNYEVTRKLILVR